MSRILPDIVNLFLLAVIIIAVVTVYYTHDLPNHKILSEYRPAVTTKIYTENGELLKEYARERRTYTTIDEIPVMLRNAFIAAEDKNYYNHAGIDINGIMRALQNNLMFNSHLQGGSTITQQVAKNLLLTNERTISRKIRDIILAIRMEMDFSKERILELYLNEIYLGAGSYGVTAASQNYFGKQVVELTLEEMALLAAMPKAPSSYNPFKEYKKAIERRNIVLSLMQEEGYISADEADNAVKSPLILKGKEKTLKGEFFAEDVRQWLERRFGDNMLYEGGLVVKTTLNPKLQILAESALRNGLFDYSRRHGYNGVVNTVDTPSELNIVQPPLGAEGWKLAVVLKIDHNDRIVEIGFKDGNISYITFDTLALFNKSKPSKMLKAGDVILVQHIAKGKNPYLLRQIPKINGAVVVINIHTGKILAMTGGFSFEKSRFNRAVQAKRQPGSAFKPFVYLTALENGYTPTDMISDEPIEFSGEDKIWSPHNYSGKFYGSMTLRKGLEKSLNVLTVQLAISVGLDKIIEMAKRFGVTKSPPRNMSTVLGAAETNLLSLTAAYAMIANGGKKLTPFMINYVKDRAGNTLYENKIKSKKQIIDEQTAYQMISILKGVVERGTGRKAKVLNKHLAGKTGTTNKSIDSWFVGFSDKIAVGVYTGFDSPKSLGEHESGATVALPIFVEFMKNAMKNISPIPQKVPEGIRLIEIDSKTGLLPSYTTPMGDIILEAFKSGTEPKLTIEKNATTAIDGVY